MPNKNGRGQGSRGQRWGSSQQYGRGLGASGNCVCLKCGNTVPKKAGRPCLDERCSKCGIALVREGGAHYQRAINNKAEEV